MDTKCPICKKSSVQPVNLKCAHRPCYSCAHTLASVDTDTKLETKYKITCPACRKKTVFYDLRHLIITETIQNEEDLFVTDRYIERKAEEKINAAFNKRNSIQSILNVNYSSTPNSQITAKHIEVRCPTHSQIIRYACLDCESIAMCSECVKVHREQTKHRIAAISQAQERVLAECSRTQNGLVKRKHCVDTICDELNGKQSNLQDNYLKLEADLNDQFRKLYQIISNKYQHIKQTIKDNYDQTSSQIARLQEQIAEFKQEISVFQGQNIASLEASVVYHLNYQEIEKTFRIIEQAAAKTLAFRGTTLGKHTDSVAQSVEGWIVLLNKEESVKKKVVQDWRTAKENERPPSLYQEFGGDRRRASFKEIDA